MRRILKKLGAAICLLIVALTLCIGALPSAAADKVGLTFVCERNGEIMSDIQWKLYKIGTYDGRKITMTGDFADYKVTFGDYSGKALGDAASTLENYVIVNKPTPAAEGVSDKNGMVYFSGMEDGTYLAIAKRLKDGIRTVVPAPTIFNVDINNGPSLQVFPKFKILLTLDAEVRRFEVRKVWENPRDLPMKKTEITVDIYEDGELSETVKLSEANDWKYNWMVFDDGTDWRVIERELPEDCTVIYRSDGVDYVVVNTYEPDIPEETTTTKLTGTTTTKSGETTTTTASTTLVSDDSDKRTDPNDQVVTTAPSASTTKPSSDIPQTGQLWWPVPLLVILGLVFIAAGIRIMTTGKKKND